MGLGGLLRLPRALTEGAFAPPLTLPLWARVSCVFASRTWLNTGLLLPSVFRLVVLLVAGFRQSLASSQ
eukprot:12829867-Prorocentrum_lima.AAC.1